MSEFKRYEPDYEDSTMQFSVGDVFVMSPIDNGDWCLYEDVEPIIQRNKELEAEIARLREQNPAQLPDGWKLVPIICTPEIESVYSNDTGAYQTAQELHDAMLEAASECEVKPCKFSILIDCRQCAHFVWRSKGCDCIYLCVNGKQYERVNPIQVFRK
jgi:hypothetical protein